MSFEIDSLPKQDASLAHGKPSTPRTALKRSRYRAIALACALSMAGIGQAAPSMVVPGQLGIVSISATNPKPLSFVLMCNAKAGTTLELTDNGWTTAGVFRPGEGVLTWVASRDIGAGEVLSIIGSNTASPSALPEGSATVRRVGSFDFAAAGDSVLVYQGTAAQLAFIFGLNHVTSGAWDANAIDSNTSALPASLVNGQSAVALPLRAGLLGQDYTGALVRGSAAQLLTAIATASNWTARTGTAPSAAKTVFEVTDAMDCADMDGGSVGPQPQDPDSITRISALRSVGANNPMLGRQVKVSAVVSAFLPGMSGFALQEADATGDDNRVTSDGIFVYYGNNPPPGANAQLVGKRVTLTGMVTEFRGQTQLSSIRSLEVGAEEAVPMPSRVNLPVASESAWAQREGMLVQVCASNSEPLVVTDTYELGRFGNVVFSAGARQAQFTHLHAPSVANNQTYLQQARLNRIILDNGISTQNPAEHLGRNGQLLSASNSLRGGDQTDCITGLLDRFIDPARAEHQIDYRIQPTQKVVVTGPERPSVSALQLEMRGSNLKAASVNVLNFFLTPTEQRFTVPGTNISHPGRGATTRVNVAGETLTGEYQRQLDKLLAKLLALDADIYGLNEIQNDGFGVSGSLATLVAELNAKAGEGVYAYSGSNGLSDGTRNLQALGTDAISVAIVYNTQRVQALGEAVAPDVNDYDAFTTAHGNRVPVAQTFRVLSLPQEDPDALVTFAVNHFKSKGSVINGERDQGDGQGANNPSRMVGARQLKEWLATNPTGFAGAHVILSGDFNAYNKEDPIRILEEAGYRLQNQEGDHYSYTFNGLWGSLDHMLTSPSMEGKVNAVVKWAVNAEEPTVLDYTYRFKTRAQIDSYYSADFYRASDHNPLLVGFALGSIGTVPVDPAPIKDFELDVPDSSSGAVLRGSLAGGGGTCSVVGAPTLAAPTSLPANVHLPYQLLQWELDGCAVGSTVTVTMNLPEPVPANAQYWKWGVTSMNQTAHWYTIPFEKTGPQQIQFKIQDGGLGDNDLQVNGHIVDPGGLGVPAPVILPPTGGVTPVPVDSPWMLGLLGALLAGVGAVRTRRAGRKASM